MYRYLLEVYSSDDLIFFMEFKSINSVAKTIDRFFNVEKLDIWFSIYDTIKDKNISAKELMRIWHT